MTWKWSLAFNNDDGKTLYKKNNKLEIYLQKKIKKLKLVFWWWSRFQSHLSSSDLVHVTFPEMEIKKLEQFFNY